MNAADAMNAATYALAQIEKVAGGEQLSFTDWSQEDDSAKVDEVQTLASDALKELEEAGFYEGHNL